MDKARQSRVPALDALRIFAFFCVVAVHFFLHSGYYDLELSGGKMYIATLMRTFFIICVPLFLMLSGYLMHNKKANKRYYTKLTRIIVEYVLASVFCMLYPALKHGESLHDILRYIFIQSFGILSYETAKYGWYVEMYIGLFLLIPFLNILYNGLQDKKQKQYLILTMLLLAGIPQVLNSVRFSFRWSMIYNDPSDFLKVFPNWWSFIYPITYYFIGAYLKEYPLRLSKWKTAALLFATTLFAGTYSFFMTAEGKHAQDLWQNYQSLFTVIQSVSVFHFFCQLDLSKVPAAGQKILSHISDLCFCAYLVSYVFDCHFYELLSKNGEPLVYKLHYFFILIPLIFVCSLISSFVMVTGYKILQNMVKKCFLPKKEKQTIEE